MDCLLDVEGVCVLGDGCVSGPAGIKRPRLDARLAACRACRAALREGPQRAVELSCLWRDQCEAAEKCLLRVLSGCREQPISVTDEDDAQLRAALARSLEDPGPPLGLRCVEQASDVWSRPQMCGACESDPPHPSKVCRPPGKVSVQKWGWSEGRRRSEASGGSEHAKATRVCCVVDEAAERLHNNDPNRIYERMRQKLEEAQRAAGGEDAAIEVGTGRWRLALGDYQWVARNPEGAPGDDAVDDHDMGGGLVLPYLVERKTVRDLVGRSVQQDHWKQLRRMRASGLAHCFLLIEMSEASADRHKIWGMGVSEGALNEVAADVIREMADVYALVADLILCAGSAVKTIESDNLEGSLRVLAAITVTAAAEGAAPAEAPRLEAFATDCRRQARRLAQQPLILPDALDYGALPAGGHAGMPGEALGEVQGLPLFFLQGGGLALVHAPGKAYLDIFVEMYLEASGMSQLPNAGLGCESVMEAAKLCAAMFVSAFGPSRPAEAQRTVLIVEGVANEYNTRRRRNARSAETLALPAQFAGGPRVLECLSLFELQLIVSHDWHVKRTHNPRESILFAHVLQQRSTVGAACSHRDEDGGIEGSANEPIAIDANDVEVIGFPGHASHHEIIDLC
ncbi:hypothetical protein CYMTET_13544 [Cymbomonas tetramitiformis]|uniref:Crossover junction endonuclease MUS81 n=1 Tax=Cymbomonas tetramitiformis TaxID=36881 RepID=A0AAE0LBB7_9CHLO|nr:hypothetical protein CYMTET_13544 [Cymbomonas tetramitiformis]